MARSWSLLTACMTVAFVEAIITIAVVLVVSGAVLPPSHKQSSTTTALPFCHELAIEALDNDPCASNPCVTGHCIDIGDGFFKCSCTDGWHGTRCNTGFLCADVDDTCLPFSAICNQSVECPNNLDESRCCGGDTPIRQYMCEDITNCIVPDEICDGKDDCQDTSGYGDETYFCGSTCTITAPPEVPELASTTIACKTTSRTFTTVSTTSLTLTTVSGTTTATAAITGNAKNSFFDKPGSVTAVFTVSGVAVAGAAAFATYYHGYDSYDGDHEIRFLCYWKASPEDSEPASTTIAHRATSLTFTTVSTTSLTSTTVSGNSQSTTDIVAITGNAKKSFFDNPGTVAAVFTVSGVAVAGAAAFATYYLCKIKERSS